VTLVNQQLRITNDIDEQDVSALEFYICGMVGRRLIHSCFYRLRLVTDMFSEFFHFCSRFWIISKFNGDCENECRFIRTRRQPVGGEVELLVAFEADERSASNIRVGAEHLRPLNYNADEEPFGR
jgi:hypothetical protein